MTWENFLTSIAKKGRKKRKSPTIQILYRFIIVTIIIIHCVSATVRGKEKKKEKKKRHVGETTTKCIWIGEIRLACTLVYVCVLQRICTVYRMYISRRKYAAEDREKNF